MRQRVREREIEIDSLSFSHAFSSLFLSLTEEHVTLNRSRTDALCTKLLFCIICLALQRERGHGKSSMNHDIEEWLDLLDRSERVAQCSLCGIASPRLYDCSQGCCVPINTTCFDCCVLQKGQSLDERATCLICWNYLLSITPKPFDNRIDDVCFMVPGDVLNRETNFIKIRVMFLRDELAIMRRGFVETERGLCQQLRRSQEAVRWAQVDLMECERPSLNLRPFESESESESESIGTPVMISATLAIAQEEELHRASCAFAEAVFSANARNMEMQMVAECNQFGQMHLVASLRAHEHVIFHRCILREFGGLNIEVAGLLQLGLASIDHAISDFERFLTQSSAKLLKFIGRKRSAIYLTGERLEKWERKEARREERDRRPSDE